jgi:prepilin-type N-terminal cleavage/methylation domain-containing protein
MKQPRRYGFTIIELLVVVSIIALLIGILLPAISKARDQARLTMSQANLRNLAAALDAYSSEFADRQPTALIDSIGQYGGSSLMTKMGNYESQTGVHHPHLWLGRSLIPSGTWARIYYNNEDTGWLYAPIDFSARFGSFRFLHQTKVLNYYLNGRFYDPVYYAPKDTIPLDIVDITFDRPEEIMFVVPGLPGDENGAEPGFSSYCFSPAAMYNPQVLAHPNQDGVGYKSPGSLPGAYRSPGVSQARYPDLKTRMLEHHWLQNKRGPDCNPGFQPGHWDGCEPYYFNHSIDSSPVTLFFDGHIGSIGVASAVRADQRMRQQSGDDAWGLWSKDTPSGSDGYFQQYAFDQGILGAGHSSFHIFTTDGILGRDIVSE